MTRPQVSRLLKRARAEGIVEIRIVDRTVADSPAADALRRSYGLDAVHLAPTIAGPEDLTRRMVGRRRRGGAARGVARRGHVGVGDGASVAAVAAARSRRPPRRSRVTVVPLCGGYWSTGPEREPYRRVADALGGQARGLMAPGLVDDAATQTGARRPRGRPRDRRALGSARRRALRDRRAGLERGAARRRRRARARVDRCGRRGPGRAVRPRRPVRLPGAARAGHRLRRAPPRPGPGRASGSPPARARSGRSSARSAPASSGRW